MWYKTTWLGDFTWIFKASHFFSATAVILEQLGDLPQKDNE